MMGCPMRYMGRQAQHTIAATRNSCARQGRRTGGAWGAIASPIFLKIGGILELCITNIFRSKEDAVLKVISTPIFYTFRHPCARLCPPATTEVAPLLSKLDRRLLIQFWFDAFLPAKCSIDLLLSVEPSGSVLLYGLLGILWFLELLLWFLKWI